MTFGGSQVSLGNDDTGLSGNSATNNQLFNAEIFDNLTITDVVPEPASLGLLAVAGLDYSRAVVASDCPQKLNFNPPPSAMLGGVCFALKLPPFPSIIPRHATGERSSDF